jgi:AAA15 family ATPase/GTPase
MLTDSLTCDLSTATATVGKSNLMDAISFVLGIQSAHLRSSKLKDLVYRSERAGHEDVDDQGKGSAAKSKSGRKKDKAAKADAADLESDDEHEDSPKTASVTAVYMNNAEEELRFSRMYDVVVVVFGGQLKCIFFSQHHSCRVK